MRQSRAPCGFIRNGHPKRRPKGYFIPSPTYQVAATSKLENVGSQFLSLSDPLMWADFQALCDLGGRLAGSEGEAAALAFAQARLAAGPGAKGRRHPREYPRLRCA